MLKLILHHTYKSNGQAVDISHHGTHGFLTSVTYQPDGTAQGSGVLAFSGGNSNVTVPNSEVWQRLGAVKIEMWVKLPPNPPVQRLNLVEGELAFAFFINSDRSLMGTFLGPASPGASPTWHGADSVNQSPDGVARYVPLDQWVKLTYIHDGMSSLRLFIGDTLVAGNYNLVAGVPSVQLTGVHIGHWVGDNRYTLTGGIDTLKIWKYDPEAPIKQFYCRPMDPKELACWGRFYNRFAREWDDKENGNILQYLMICVERAVEHLVRLVRSKGERALETNRKFSHEYRKLFCSGKMDSKEMEDFFVRWLNWLCELLGKDEMNRFIDQIMLCWQRYESKMDWLKKAAEAIPECDEPFTGYMKRLINAVKRVECIELFEEEPEVTPEPKTEPELFLVTWIKQLFNWVSALFRRIFGGE